MVESTSLNNDGTIEVSSGTLRNEISSYWGTGSRIIGPGFVENAGTVQVTGPGVSVDNVRMVSPTSQLIVDHDLTIRDTFDWQAGTLTGSGMTVLEPDAVCKITAGSLRHGPYDQWWRHRGVVRRKHHRFLDRSDRHADRGLHRQGTCGRRIEPRRHNHLEHAGSLLLNAAAVHNQGIFVVEQDAAITWYRGSTAFYNNGSIEVVGGNLQLSSLGNSTTTERSNSLRATWNSVQQIRSHSMTPHTY